MVGSKEDRDGVDLTTVVYNRAISGVSFTVRTNSTALCYKNQLVI